MPRWNTNTWLLVCLGTVVLLLAGGLTRRALFPPREADPKSQAGPKDKQGNAVTWQPKVGGEARDFALPDGNQQVHTLSTFKGKGDVLLTFFCGCGACADFAKQLAETYRKNPGKAPPTVSVFTSHF